MKLISAINLMKNTHDEQIHLTPQKYQRPKMLYVIILILIRHVPM